MSAARREGRTRGSCLLFFVVALALTALAIGSRVAADLVRWC